MRKLLFLLTLIPFPFYALSHEAPTGWAYGWDCCSNQDCKQAAKGQVVETPQGYKVNADPEVLETIVPYKDKKIHPSKDEFFHVCSKVNGDHSLICLYVPQGAT